MHRSVTKLPCDVSVGIFFHRSVCTTANRFPLRCLAATRGTDATKHPQFRRRFPLAGMRYSGWHRRVRSRYPATATCRVNDVAISPLRMNVPWARRQLVPVVHGRAPCATSVGPSAGAACEPAGSNYRRHSVQTTVAYVSSSVSDVSSRNAATFNRARACSLAVPPRIFDLFSPVLATEKRASPSSQFIHPAHSNGVKRYFLVSKKLDGASDRPPPTDPVWILGR